MDPGLTILSDKELLSGCFMGDRSCQETFVLRFSNLVYGKIQRALKAKNIQLDQQFIEDLHQTVFLQLFDRKCRKLRQYKGKNGCSLASWICIVTGHTVLDHLRRGTDALSHRHQAAVLELATELHETGSSPIDQLTNAEQLRQIELGLKQLKARDQLVIRMHYMEGRPIQKVAQVLGISKKNIYSAKHRAIQRLKVAIKCKNR